MSAGFESDLDERDRAIVRLRAEGETLRLIGRRYGISRERVRHILLGLDAVDSTTAAAVRAARQAEAADARREEVLSGWRQGEKPGAIAARLAIPHKSVASVVAIHATGADRATRRLALSLGQRGTRGNSDRQLADAIRRVAEGAGHTPTCQEYRHIATSLGLPSLSTVTNRFGGWDAALRAAGLTRAAQNPRWTEEGCLQALRELREQLGELPTTSEYERLSRNRSDLPCCATLRKRLGSWPQITLQLADDTPQPRARNGVHPLRAPVAEAPRAAGSVAGRESTLSRVAVEISSRTADSREETVEATCLVVDGQPLARHGLKLLLAGEPDIELIDTLASGADALQVTEREHPAVMVLDPRLRDMDGLIVARQIVALGTAVVIYSADPRAPVVADALAAGVRGYVSKKSDPQDLLRAIRSAASGSPYIDPSLALLLLGGDHGTADQHGAVLSDREREVLRLLALGFHTKGVARHMGLRRATVKSATERGVHKLNAEGRTHAVAVAQRSGLIE